MNETVTLDHLILYLYNETELSDTVMIQKAIDHDEETASEFENLVAARNLIDRTLMSPSSDSLATVLAYAKLTAPLQSV
ncbi:MAG: hypothetical protein JNL88_08505 [Bacteroidia bacterium]|nr:hypothetical protein [Bacteroidia bacterium]